MLQSKLLQMPGGRETITYQMARPSELTVYQMLVVCPRPDLNRTLIHHKWVRLTARREWIFQKLALAKGCIHTFLSVKITSLL